MARFFAKKKPKSKLSRIFMDDAVQNNKQKKTFQYATDNADNTRNMQMANGREIIRGS